MNVLDRIDGYLTEQDKKCPEGERWCPVEKKCVLIGSGNGNGRKKKNKGE